MHPYKLITVSQSGTIGYYEPPQTNPYKTLQTFPPDAISNTLPLLTHQKSSIHHPPSKSRISTSPITALTAQPPLLATGNAEGFVSIYAHPSARPTTIPLHINTVTELRFCDALENIISSGVDGFVHITRLSHPSKPAVSLRHPLPVTTFALGYASTTARIITSSPDRSTRVWHLASARLLTTLHHTARVTALAVTVGEDFSWGSCDGSVGSVAISDLPVGASVLAKPFAKREAPVTSLAHTPEGLVVGFGDGVVQMFDSVSHVLIRTFGGGAAVSRVFVAYNDDDGGDMFYDGLQNDAVVIGKRQPPHAWDIVKRVAEGAFREDSGASVVDSENEVMTLRDEVERLRKRNRELEDAGTKLVELVERGG